MVLFVALVFGLLLPATLAVDRINWYDRLAQFNKLQNFYDEYAAQGFTYPDPVLGSFYNSEVNELAIVTDHTLFVLDMDPTLPVVQNYTAGAGGFSDDHFREAVIVDRLAENQADLFWMGGTAETSCSGCHWIAGFLNVSWADNAHKIAPYYRPGDEYETNGFVKWLSNITDSGVSDTHAYWLTNWHDGTQPVCRLVRYNFNNSYNVAEAPGSGVGTTDDQGHVTIEWKAIANTTAMSETFDGLGWNVRDIEGYECDSFELDNRNKRLFLATRQGQVLVWPINNFWNFSGINYTDANSEHFDAITVTIDLPENKPISKLFHHYDDDLNEDFLYALFPGTSSSNRAKLYALPVSDPADYTIPADWFAEGKHTFSFVVPTDYHLNQGDIDPSGRFLYLVSKESGGTKAVSFSMFDLIDWKEEAAANIEDIPGVASANFVIPQSFSNVFVSDGELIIVGSDYFQLASETFNSPFLLRMTLGDSTKPREFFSPYLTNGQPDPSPAATLTSFALSALVAAAAAVVLVL